MSVLIVYYMDGCGHCDDFIRDILPDIKGSHIMIESKNTIDDIKTSHLDKSELEKVFKWKEENVSGYPTLAKWDKTGGIKEFTGARTADAIKQFLSIKGGKRRKKGRKTKSKNKRGRKTRKYWN